MPDRIYHQNKGNPSQPDRYPGKWLLYDYPVKRSAAEDLWFMLIYCVALPLLYMACLKGTLWIPMAIFMPWIEAGFPEPLRRTIPIIVGFIWGLMVIHEYCEVCSCEPMSPETRQRFLDDQYAHLMIAGLACAMVLFISTFTLGWWLIPAWILGCFVLFLTHFRDIVEPIRHWLTYHTKGIKAVGLYRSSYGPRFCRWIIYLVVIFILFLCALPDMVKSFTEVRFLSPVLYPLLTLGCTTVPILALVSPACRKFRDAQAELREFKDLNEVIRPSAHVVPPPEYLFFPGRVASDGASVPMNAALLDENILIEGPAGSNKTSMGLCPLIEHTILSGDDE